MEIKDILYHYDSHGKSNWKNPVANIGLKTNFGGGHHSKQQNIPRW